jgi:Holliday junction resolvasome RuvABC ATP-dependent DNA helicase subunit
MDFLYKREVIRDDAEEPERGEVTEELAEELEELELDNDGLQLEDEEAMRALEADVVGGDINVTQSISEMRLNDPEISSNKAAGN